MDDSTNTVNVGLGTVADNTYNYMNNLLSNPSLIIILVIVIIIYVIIFLSLGSSNEVTEDVSNPSSNIIYVILIAFFIVLIIINGFQYFFGFDIVAKLKNLFSGSPEVDINVETTIPKTPVPEIVLKPQVFNIPGNNYIYPDAKALCTAYGARLATYKEIEDSYNNGGEWCNYGWSDGQMALYPTQEETYNNLQKIKGHENDCGRPGINGGYMANPYNRYGVNCYGVKPVMNEEEKELMKIEKSIPDSAKMDADVNYWKNKIPNILISPFNSNTWSKL